MNRIIPLCLLLIASSPFIASLEATQFPVQSPQEVFTEKPGHYEFSGRLIARPLQPNMAKALGLSRREVEIRRIAAQLELEQYEVREYVPETDEYLISIPSGFHENDVVRKLIRSGHFEYVEPDWILFWAQVPNDPMYSQQRHHRPNLINSAVGWDIYAGDPSIAIAVCDSGVRTDHEDLLRHRLEGYNAVDELWESQGGQVGAIQTHGTRVTGCAAANGNNGVGIAGVGWNLSHRMLRVTNSVEGGASIFLFRHAVRVAAQSGDRVINVSANSPDARGNRTLATYVKSLGGLLVWAAGNDGLLLDLNYRDDDDIIVVGATNLLDERIGLSSRGPYVDLYAPGELIFTTDSVTSSAYGSYSGTSFAAPLVAGLCGLIWSVNPSLTPDEVETIVKLTCDDKGELGVDDEFGYGRINVGEAMIMAQGINPPSADFNASSVQGTAPLMVRFRDQSTGMAASWSWDFGDGSTSNLKDPVHTYAAPGTYGVKLTVTNFNGTDSEFKLDYIQVDF